MRGHLAGWHIAHGRGDEASALTDKAIEKSRKVPIFDRPKPIDVLNFVKRVGLKIIEERYGENDGRERATPGDYERHILVSGCKYY